MGDLDLIPGLGRSPGGRHGNPLQYSCLENPHGRRSLVGYSPWGCKELDMTERLTYTRIFHAVKTLLIFKAWFKWHTLKQGYWCHLLCNFTVDSHKQISWLFHCGTCIGSVCVFLSIPPVDSVFIWLFYFPLPPTALWRHCEQVVYVIHFCQSDISQKIMQERLLLFIYYILPPRSIMLFDFFR